jgi:ketosteroid isomerase-like protein
MSERNVAAVHRFVEAVVSAQGTDDLGPVLAEVDADVEIDDWDISLDSQHYRGHEGIRGWIAVWNESWESWSIEDLAVEPLGEDRVIALFLMRVKGKGSGIELSRRDAVLCTMGAGKITQVGYYNDQQKAREAAAEG